MADQLGEWLAAHPERPVGGPTVGQDNRDYTHHYALLDALNPVNAFGRMADIVTGAHATRAVLSGKPMDAFHPLDKNRQNSFGVLGDMLATPNVAKLGMGLGKIGVNAAREFGGNLAPSAEAGLGFAAQLRSPNGGRFLKDLKPGDTQRLRPAGSPPTVANPAPPRGTQLPAPAPLKALENNDPVAQYERLTAGWRGDPLAEGSKTRLNMPPAPDPGRSAALGVRNANRYTALRKELGNDAPERPMETYKPPAHVLEAARDPNRTIGSESAAIEGAQRNAANLGAARDASIWGRLGTLGSKMAGQAQSAGQQLMSLFGRGGGGPMPDRGQFAGYSRPGISSALQERGTFRRLVDPSANVFESVAGETPVLPNLGEVASLRSSAHEALGPNQTSRPGLLADLQRSGRMFKEVDVPPDAEGLKTFRGVGGTASTKTPAMNRFGEATAGALEANHPNLLGFSNEGNAMRPGVSGAFQRKEIRAAEGYPFGETVRHERAHGIMQEALRRGSSTVDKLPAYMRVPTQLSASSVPFNQGTGFWMDEAVARALEKRAPVDQVRNSAKFIFSNGLGRPQYAEEVRKLSPTAGAVFDTLPEIAKAARGSAILGVSPLMNAVQRGNSEF